MWLGPATFAWFDDAEQAMMMARAPLKTWLRTNLGFMPAKDILLTTEIKQLLVQSEGTRYLDFGTSPRDLLECPRRLARDVNVGLEEGLNSNCSSGSGLQLR